MINKKELQITEKMFSLENDVITLALSAPYYDLTGKTITAVFSPSGIETEPLEAVDGVIQIPIYSSMIKKGVNFIQLNFRWGTTKLEQSGKLMWVIGQSLETTGPAQEDVDIITYLVNIATQAKKDADTALLEANRIVEEAGDVRFVLDESVETAGESKEALDESISLANTTKTELDESIQDANTINASLTDEETGTIKRATDINIALENNIDDAVDVNAALSHDELGTIKRAADIKQSLEETIDDAGESKVALEGSIKDAGTAKSNLEDVIGAANTKKTELVDTIDNANTKINEITNPDDGTIKKTNDAKVSLEEKITEAGTAKTQIEDAITNNQIVTLPEFNAHKEEYTQYKDTNNLKIAKVEKDINDYQSTMANVNVNQEAKQKVTDYGIVSLPKNTANGQVSATVKGNTVNQLLEGKGDTLDGWLETTGTTIVNNFFKVDVAVGLITSYPVNIVNGNKYYIAVNYQAVGAGRDLSILLRDGITNVAGSFILNTTDITMKRKSDILTATANGDRLRFFRVAGTDEGYYNLQGLMLINLTQTFGSGNEPTVEQCDLMFPNYFDGTKSTISASRLKSVGKNILPPNSFEQGSVDLAGIIYNDITRIRTKFIQVISNQYYVISGSPRHVFWFWYDLNKNFIGSDLVASYTKKSPTTARYVILRQGGSNDAQTATVWNNSSVQLEKGAVATPYEPYTESTSYLPNVGELRSLPNGTKDEVRVSGGKAEKVKRVSDKVVLDGSLNWRWLATSQELTYRIQINSWGQSNNIALLTETNSIASNGDAAYTIQASATLSYYDYRLISMDNANGNLYLKVEKTKVDAMVGATTLDKFKAYLNLYPITLTYQLAEPIITPIEVSGTLLSNPSGTVYVENVVADAGIYNDGITTQYADLPIKEVDKLIKYDFETGVQTSLDVSKVVINADKLSFTHPDLVNGDMVFYDYSYDVESTEAETEIEYYDSRHTIKDTTNNKFYSWKISSTNGVASVDLTEV